MFCTFSGFAIVMLDNKWGHINSEGKEICGLKYDDAYGFVQKMEYDIINDLYHYLDENNFEIESMSFCKM